MKKNVFKIVLIFILIFILGDSYSYAVTIDKDIIAWVIPATGTTDSRQKEVDNILKKLKTDFEYQGDSINKQMRMQTVITVENKSKTLASILPWVEDEYKYTLRIRKRNRRPKRNNFRYK